MGAIQAEPGCTPKPKCGLEGLAHGSLCRPCRFPCLRLITTQAKTIRFSCMAVTRACSEGGRSVICSENSALSSSIAASLIAFTRTDSRSEMVLFARPKSRAKAEVSSPLRRRWHTASHCSGLNLEGLPRPCRLAIRGGILTSPRLASVPARGVPTLRATPASFRAPCMRSWMKRSCLLQSWARCFAPMASICVWPWLVLLFVPVSIRSTWLRSNSSF